MAAFSPVRANFLKLLNDAKRSDPDYDAALDELKTRLEEVTRRVTHPDECESKTGLK